MDNVRFPTKETSVTHRRNERTLSKKLSFLFKGNSRSHAGKREFPLREIIKSCMLTDLVYRI